LRCAPRAEVGECPGPAGGHRQHGKAIRRWDERWVQNYRTVSVDKMPIGAQWVPGPAFTQAWLERPTERVQRPVNVGPGTLFQWHLIPMTRSGIFSRSSKRGHVLGPGMHKRSEHWSCHPFPTQ
jgi:hypothetical protein